MYSQLEMQLMRDAAGPGAVIPGVDTQTGNKLPTASLVKAETLGTQSGYYYSAYSHQVIVTQDGVNLSGIDFGNNQLLIKANNVTVTNCTFEPTSIYYSVVDDGANTTVRNCTFTGPTYSTPLADFIRGGGSISIKDNTFVDSPCDAITLSGGVVTGNYFSSGGYQAGGHADAIWVPSTSAPVTITDNFVDWTPNADDTTGFGPGQAIRITTEGGNTSDVTASGNYLLGGSYTIQVGLASAGTFSNVLVTGNYIGFRQLGGHLSQSPGRLDRHQQYRDRLA